MNVRMPQAIPGDAAAPSPPQAGGAQQKSSVAAAVLPGTAQAEAIAAPQSRQPEKEQLEQAMENLRRATRATGQSNLQFSIDGDSGQTVIRVVDSTTNELIRQIPSEDVLTLARELDKLQGLLLKQQA